MHIKNVSNELKIQSISYMKIIKINLFYFKNNNDKIKF